jgi:uncharacterized phage protein (TIGR02218 family)
VRSIPPGLAARLEGPATTLAHAFVVVRADGAAFGFTDHDRPLAVDGVVCEPGGALERSAATSHDGLAVGEEDLAGALTSDGITDADLAAGLWDGAEVTVHLVDWEAPEHRMVLRRGRIGEVVRADGAFRAELRGPAAALDTVTGRRFLPTCDAALGDARCGLDLAALAFYAVAADGSDAAALVVEGAGTGVAGRFTGGRVRVASGPLEGREAEVEDHRVEAGRVVLSLRRPLPAAPTAGIPLVLTPGCDKTFATCVKVFANGVSFRGFPHMPGRDAAFAYAREGDRHDGGSLDR